MYLVSNPDVPETDKIIERVSQERWRPSGIVAGYCMSCGFIELWSVLVFGAHTLPSCAKVLLTLRRRQRLRYSQ